MIYNKQYLRNTTALIKQAVDLLHHNIGSIYNLRVVYPVPTEEMAAALELQGRESLEKVNDMRGLAGMKPIREKENQTPVICGNYTADMIEGKATLVQITNGLFSFTPSLQKDLQGAIQATQEDSEGVKFVNEKGSTDIYIIQVNG